MYHCLLESSDAEIAAALRALLSSAERGAPALFFCRAGKDRTGLVAALVLSVCGASDEAILDDYVLSDDPTAAEIALGGLERSRDLQGLDTRVFARAPRDAMEKALRRLRSKHGSVERYLDERAGFSLAEQARLRAALAGNRPTPAL
jgi:protein tyrosine/serine phosphatase